MQKVLLALIYVICIMKAMNKTILNKAIKKAGSQAALARQLGVTRQLICNVKRGTPAGKKFVNKVIDYLENKS